MQATLPSRNRLPIPARIAAGAAAFVIAALIVQRNPQAAGALLVLPVVAAVWLVSRRDAVTVLTALVVLLFGIPPRYVVGPLGGVGTPAMLLAVGAAAWWAAGIPVPSIGRARDRQPVRIAVLLYALAMLLSYLAAMLRPLSQIEATAADRHLVLVLALSGITLLVADGVTDRQRLDALLRRLVLAAALLGTAGIVQFATGFDIATQIQPPGLRLLRNFSGITERANLPRVSGTAEHAIEFGLVLTMALPLAIHYARWSPRSRQRLASWVAVGILAVAIPLSLARSALIATVVGLVVLSLAWSGRSRARLAAALLLAPVVLGAVAPALLDAIVGLFVRAAEDPSVLNRLADFGPVLEIAAGSPLVGIGLGTFDPNTQFVVDNEYLVVLMESGILGLGALVALLVVSVSCARQVRRRSTDGATRHLAQSLVAAVVVAALGLAAFGFLSFKIISAVTFLVIGATGALWRLDRFGPLAPPPPLPPLEPREVTLEPRPPTNELTLQLQRALADEEALVTVVEALPGIGDQRAVVQALLEEVRDGLAPASAAVWLPEESGIALRPVATYGHPDRELSTRVRMDHPVLMRLVGGRPRGFLLGSGATRGILTGLPRTQGTRFAAVPLFADGRLYGMVTVSGEGLDRDDLEWLLDVAVQGATLLAVGRRLRHRWLHASSRKRPGRDPR